MKTVAKVKKIGGSLMVHIPAKLAQKEKISENDIVSLEVKPAKKDWFGALKGIGKLTKEDRLKEHDIRL